MLWLTRSREAPTRLARSLCVRRKGMWIAPFEAGRPYCVGGSIDVLQQAHLALDVAGAAEGDDHVGAIGLFDVYFDGAAENDIHAIAWLLRDDQTGSGPEGPAVQ